WPRWIGTAPRWHQPAPDRSGGRPSARRRGVAVAFEHRTGDLVEPAGLVVGEGVAPTPDPTLAERVRTAGVDGVQSLTDHVVDGEIAAGGVPEGRDQLPHGVGP